MKKFVFTTLAVAAFSGFASASNLEVKKADDCTTQAMNAAEANDLNSTKSDEENYGYYQGYKDACESE